MSQQHSISGIFLMASFAECVVLLISSQVFSWMYDLPSINKCSAILYNLYS